MMVALSGVNHLVPDGDEAEGSADQKEKYSEENRKLRGL
jgi:hypothetical protein